MVDKIKASNTFWQPGLVSRADRIATMRQKGCVIWITGLSGSGKSTIARELEKELMISGRIAYVLDGDNIRHGLSKDLGFSPEDRGENIRRIGEVGALFADANVITIAAFISPYKKDRLEARRVCAEGQFFEIFLDCSLEVCEKRDPKGLYRKARRGEINDFTGIDAPYERPEHPELVFDTSKTGADQCVKAVLALITARGILLENS